MCVAIWKKSSILAHLRNMRRSAPVLYWFIVIELLFEFAGIVILPEIITKTKYLSWYLGPQSIAATHRFLENDAYLIPDQYSGWRNRPNVAKDNWVIDARGARTTQHLSKGPLKSERILFLGSSMVNGGTHVKNDETITGYFENADIEALNFGTMLYSMDQCLLFYKHELYKYRAKYLVVGLDLGSIGGLKNHYIPLRAREETNTPYIKPRYELADGKLRLIPVQPRVQLANVPQSRHLIDFLSKNDHYYDSFGDYCRMGLFPISNAVLYAFRKVSNLCDYFRHDEQSRDLLVTIMSDFVRAARQNDASVTFIMMPGERDFSRRGIYRILPDQYSKVFHAIEARGFNVIDARQIFLLSRHSRVELFCEDGVHYRPLANRLIAQALKDQIQTIH